jgi:two-component system chemotaxis response regulator CheY
MGFTNTVLIVDDEPHVRMYLKLILKKIGFKYFIEAKDGQEGIDLYKSRSPDLVLLDVNMPVKEGMEVLEEIMQFDYTAVVVVISSVASRQAVEQSVELGASYYIRKDTPKAMIVDQLDTLIKNVWE